MTSIERQPPHPESQRVTVHGASIGLTSWSSTLRDLHIVHPVKPKLKVVLGLGVFFMAGASFAGGIAVGRKVPGDKKSPPIVTAPPSAPGGEAETVIDTTCATTQLRVLNLGKPVVWAGLGDSYSAGVGGPLNQQLWGQDVFNAYSVAAVQRVKANDALKIQLNLGACGGAKVPELVGDLTAASVAVALKSLSGLDSHWWSAAPPPLRGLRDADVASISLGGNDVGFGEIGKQCALSTCDDIADGGPAVKSRGQRRTLNGPPFVIAWQMRTWSSER